MVMMVVVVVVFFFTAKLISIFSAVSSEVSKLQCLRANAFMLAAFSSTSQKRTHSISLCILVVLFSTVDIYS